MQNLIEFLKKPKIKKIIKIIIIILLLPITLYLVNDLILLINTLGRYLGTFLRNLYDIVC